MTKWEYYMFVHWKLCIKDNELHCPHCAFSKDPTMKPTKRTLFGLCFDLRVAGCRHPIICGHKQYVHVITSHPKSGEIYLILNTIVLTIKGREECCVEHRAKKEQLFFFLNLTTVMRYIWYTLLCFCLETLHTQIAVENLFHRFRNKHTRNKQFSM